MTMLLAIGFYAAYAAFWLRFLAHALIWYRARPEERSSGDGRAGIRSCALTAADIACFARLFMVNPALWLGEWLFHWTFLLVLLRHLRYFLDPVPAWIGSLQVPGLIAGYFLPLPLAYILAIRLLASREKYSSRLNLFLLAMVLVISVLGVLMHWRFKPDLVEVKFFLMSLLGLSPTASPKSALFLLHFGLALVLVPFLPAHMFTAPFVMLEARKRDSSLPGVLHDR